MDGNRRWAAARGLPSIAGHVQGVEAIRPIVRVAPDHGHPGPLALRLQPGELAPSRGRGDRPLRPHRRAPCSSTPTSSSRRASASGHRPSPRGTVGRPAQHPQRGGAHPRRDADGPQHRFNYSGRTELIDAMRALMASGASPAEVDEAHGRRAALHRRPAGCRPAHSHRATSSAPATSCSGRGLCRARLQRDAAGPTSRRPTSIAALDEYTSRQRRFGG